MWIEDDTEEHFIKWENIEWWKTLSRKENIQSFWETIKTRKIRVHNGNEKIILGFSQTGTYNMK